MTNARESETRVVMSSDLAALRAYDTGADGATTTGTTGTMIRVKVSHSNLRGSFMEIRFDPHASIGSVKRKLMTHCGTNASAMTLVLRDEEGGVLAVMGDETRPLGYYGATRDGLEIRRGR